MFGMLERLIRGRMKRGARRSSHWPAVRAAWLKVNPRCAACGSKERPEVHHVHPVHLHPDLELDSTNFITLCTRRCHLLVGHLGDWKAYNPAVRADAETWKKKIDTRPYA